MWSRCQRQFFFKHIMASTTAGDEQRQTAHKLGGIQEIAWWQGTIVHKIIEDHLVPTAKAGRWPSASRLIKAAHDIAIPQFEFSAQGLYDSMTKADAPEDYCILAPHYFNEPLEPNALETALGMISTALENLVNSSAMRRFLIERKAYYCEKDLQFKVGTTTVRAKPDLVMPISNDGGIDIVDWKVATASSSYHFQVGVYALAVRATAWLSHHNVDRIRGYVVNLLTPDPAIALADPYMVDEETRNQIIDIIFEKSERIASLKRGRKFKELDVSQFRYANSEGSCATCNWRQFCKEIGDGTPSKLLPDQQSGPTQLALPLV